MAKIVLKIKDKNISTIIRTYKNTNNIKMYFNGRIFNVSKPKYVSDKKILKIIEQNNERIYLKYLELNLLDNHEIKHWKTGEKILYKGQYYKIKREIYCMNQTKVNIEEDKKIFNIYIPNKLQNEDEIKGKVDKTIKKIFKQNT